MNFNGFQVMNKIKSTACYIGEGHVESLSSEQTHAVIHHLTGQHGYIN